MGNLTPDLIFPLYTFKTRQVTWTQASTATLNNSEQAMTCWCVWGGRCVWVHACHCVFVYLSCVFRCVCVFWGSTSVVCENEYYHSGFPCPLGGTLCPTWDQFTDV